MIVPDDAFLQHEIEKLAVKAGRMIRSADRDVKVSTKSGRRDLVTSKDLEIQRMLMQRLDILCSPCSFLCEEDLSLPGIRQIADPEEVNEGVCFIIDPIDGTANFVHGLQHSCTSIAMTVDGKTRIGVIYDPYREELFSAGLGRGTWLNGHRLPEFDLKLADAITVFGTAPYDDSTNAPTFRMAHLLYELSADVRRTGSAALDCCWTACGRFGLYAELSLSPWDFAAGKLIAEETGCSVTDINGAPLKFEGKPSILCGRPSAVKEFLAAWKGAQNAEAKHR
ncbi:MAG: inositol monophosphatase [Firmicutes bacterium]|nr:inositol monophosphatase [Bacillota bacterium]